MESSTPVQVHRASSSPQQQLQDNERISPELAKLKLYQQDDNASEENSLKRLIVNGCKAQMLIRNSTTTNNKRQRSETEDETEPDGSWSYDKEWQYEPPPLVVNASNSRRFARRNSKVASMLQIASMMDSTTPSSAQTTEAEPPRHRYKRRNSIVDAMLHPSTRQYLMECQDPPYVVVPSTGHRFQRSSLPWNFKTPGVLEHGVTHTTD